MISNLHVSVSLPGEEVLEELQSSGLQESFLLCDGVVVVRELLLQLLQLLEVLTNLLETLSYCSEPGGGGEKGELEDRKEERDAIKKVFKVDR